MNFMLFVVLGLAVALIVVKCLDKSARKKQEKNKSTEKVEDETQLNK